MKVGVNILNFGPGVGPDALLRWAQVSEALGYHSIMISDHVAITPSVRQRYPEPYYDPFTTLAWLAGQTRKLQLGTTVCVLPYRHPILTARLTANIDQLSGSRFIFGVGVGNAQDEFEALGLPFQRRGRLANECLEVIQALWSGEPSVSYDGRLIKFEGVSGSAPLQRPGPPVWVGGASDSALLRTVRYGQAWHPIIRSLAAVKEQSLPALRQMADKEGRPAPAFCPRIRLDLRDSPAPDDRPPGAGTLDQVRADLEELAVLGAEHVNLDWFTGDLEATRDHERGWQMLAVLAHNALDLQKETLR
jgi:probable F420-dependent oxidoreductase